MDRRLLKPGSSQKRLRLMGCTIVRFVIRMVWFGVIMFTTFDGTTEIQDALCAKYVFEPLGVISGPYHVENMLIIWF